jgi:hypothetical protein
MESPLPIESLVPDGASAGFTREEIEACLALAWLAVVADGEVQSEELDAFARAARRLGGPAFDAGDLPVRFERERSDEKDRWLARQARALARPAPRDFAYQLAYIISHADIDTNDAEYRNAVRLREALGLGEAQAEELLDAVFLRLAPPDEDPGGPDRSPG